MLGDGRKLDLCQLFGNRVMIVAAHPDDEALGAGGTLSRLASVGVETHVLFLADGETSRMANAQDELTRDAIAKRREQAVRALKIHHCLSYEFKELPDNRLDTVPLLDIAREIEASIANFSPATILTHSSSDLNIDHKACLQATLIAGRPGKSSVRGIFSFEIPSSTGLGFRSTEPFIPNLYLDISEFMVKKMQALAEYGSEIPLKDHPRSRDAVERLARFRGDQTGTLAAEAFEIQRISL